MSAATSPGTGLAYGLRRVCAAWGMARSSFYAMTSGQHAEQPPAKRRGPKPAISDQALLVAIEADLEASPWEGEGYRKVWARLRVCRDIRVARKRVLRLMRENRRIYQIIGKGLPGLREERIQLDDIRRQIVVDPLPGQRVARVIERPSFSRNRLIALLTHALVNGLRGFTHIRRDVQ